MANRPNFTLMQNLSELHDFNIETKGEYVQFVEKDTKRSNRYIFQVTNDIAAFLRAAGIKRNSRIAFCCKLRPETFAILPAIWNVGATGVSIQTRLANSQIAELIGLTDAEILFIDGDKWDSAKDELRKIKSITKVVIMDGQREGCIDLASILTGKSKREKSPAKPEDHAIILFSSGSTGLPKGIVQTHKMLLAELEAFHLANEVNNDPNFLYLYTQPAKILFNTPLGHAAGTMGLTTNLVSGNTYYLQDVFDAEEMLRMIQDHKIEGYFFGPPTVYAALLAHPNFSKFDLSSMKYWLTAGAPISHERVKQLLKVLPGKIQFAYGLSETSGVSTAIYFDEHYKADCVGKAFPSIEIDIRDKDGKSLPVGEIGEVCIKGDTVSPGYLNLEEESRRAFRDGWMYTGDLGYMDEDKNLYLNGRSKLIIIQAGVNVFPRTVEVALELIPDVRECAVVGMADEILGERVVAYVALKADSRVSISDIKKHCREKLSRYEMPRQIVLVDSLPRTGTNKIDLPLLKKGYKITDKDEKARAGTSRSRQQDRRLVLLERVREIAEDMNIRGLTDEKPLMQSGFDSLAAVEFSVLVSEMVGTKVPETLIFNYPTLNDVVDYLVKLESGPKKFEPVVRSSSNGSGAVVIVGASCRLPGDIQNVDELWAKLNSNADCLIDIPKERWDVEKLYSPIPFNEGHVFQKRGGFLEGVKYHDPKFFDLTLHEATVMDPQQRLIHQMAWEAVDDSMIKPSDLSRLSTGVFIGTTNYDFTHRGYESGRSRPEYSVGFLPCYIAGRLSFWMNLSGPSVVLDTACSSGLVSIHLAAQAIRNGECDMALAGGINVMSHASLSQVASMMGVLSADGYCRALDSSAKGTVRSEGGALFLLKDLAQAERDGDRILAVIRGSGTNHDARSSSITAPNGAAQVKLFRTVLGNSGIRPEEVSYVECHATGTELGDAIEINSVHEAYEADVTRENPLFIGSVKANLGHTEGGAGAMSVMKLIALFKHSKIAPQLHLKKPNEKFDWSRSRLEVPKAAIQWPQKRKVAAVSSFGISGTNAHAILEAPTSQQAHVKKPVRSSLPERTHHVFCISAKTEKSLIQLAKKYIEMLDNDPEIDIPSLCYSVNTRRTHFNFRKAIVCRDAVQLREELELIASGSMNFSSVSKQSKMAFLFSPDAAEDHLDVKALAESSNIFKDALECGSGKLRNSVSAQYALSETLWSWGLGPTHVLGYGFGEIAAAAVAGSLPASQAVDLASAICKSRSSVADHVFFRCWAEEKSIEDALSTSMSELVTISEDAPGVFLMAGEKQAVNSAIEKLTIRGIKTKLLSKPHVQRGHHTPGFKLATGEAFQQLDPQRPVVRLVSSLYGRQIKSDESLDGSYWEKVFSSRLNYASAVQSIIADGVETFVELGTKMSLTPLGAMQGGNSKLIWKNAIHPGHDQWGSLLNLVKHLYEKGFDPDWEAFDADFERTVIKLPLYQFDLINVGIHPFTDKVESAPAVKAAPALTGSMFKLNADTPMTVDQGGETDIFNTLVGLLAEELRIDRDSIQMDSKFDALGIDSFKSIQIALDLEEKFNVQLDITQLPSSAPIAQVVDWIAKAVGTKGKAASVPVKADSQKPETSKPEASKVALAEVRQITSAKSVGLQTNIKEKVLEALVESTGLSANQFKDSTQMEELGIDSFKSIQVVLDLEEKLATQLDLTKLPRKPTYKEFETWVIESFGGGKPQEQNKDISKWLPGWTPSPNAVARLVCFHHMGGAASMYQHWGKVLGPEIEVLALQLPGRENRMHEKPYTDFQEMVKDVVDFLPAVLDKPFACFGQSFGVALMAKVAAKLAEEKGLTAHHIFLSALRAPFAYLEPGSPYGEPISDKNIHHYVEIPKGLHNSQDIMRLVMQRMKGDADVANSMQPFERSFKFPSPVLALAGTLDVIAPVTTVNSWSLHSEPDKFTLKSFEGGHLFINDHFEEVLGLIKTTLLASIERSKVTKEAK